MLPWKVYYATVALIFFSSTNVNFAKNVTKKPKDSIHDYYADVWCKQQAVGYDCDGKGTRPYFYYDIKMENCKTSYFGSCPDVVNKFSSLRECHDTCIDYGPEPIKYELKPHIFCTFQPDFGKCDNYHPMWYYDMTTQTCKGFSYSGCGGNQNRFTTKNSCTHICKEPH